MARIYGTIKQTTLYSQVYSWSSAYTLLKKSTFNHQDGGSKAFVPFNGVLLTTSGCCTCRGKKKYKSKVMVHHISFAFAIAIVGLPSRCYGTGPYYHLIYTGNMEVGQYSEVSCLVVLRAIDAAIAVPPPISTLFILFLTFLAQYGCTSCRYHIAPTMAAEFN